MIIRTQHSCRLGVNNDEVGCIKIYIATPIRNATAYVYAEEAVQFALGILTEAGVDVSPLQIPADVTA